MMCIKVDCYACDGEGAFYQNFGEGTVIEEPCGICKDGKVAIGKYLGYWLYENCKLYEIIINWIYEKESE